MAPPKGNRFWEARAKHGRPALYDDPEKLWADCLEYFQWVEENPLPASESVKFQGAGTTMTVPKMRAMTIQGLCNFLQIVMSTWQEYRKKDNFSAVCTRVEQLIYQQKIEGASADMLNASIIARELGLVDKSELTGKDGAPLNADTGSLAAIASRIDELASKIGAGGDSGSDSEADAT